MELPQPFLDRMRQMLGAEYEQWKESLDAPRVQGLRANPIKVKSHDLFSLLPMELTPVPWCKTGFYYGEDTRPGKSVFHDAGLFYIQEPSAMLPAELLSPEPGMRVLDLCAAPGGKTTQLAGKMQNQGILIANEPYPARAKILAQNIERLGICNAAVTCVMPNQLAERFEGFFDRIMVDAPCSGEGMFRKDTDTRAEWSEDAVLHCAARQWDILCCAVKMLRPGGRLVYSTCTFAPEENERIIARLLDHYDMLQVIPVNSPGVSSANPHWADEKQEIAGACRIWPHQARGEGHFAALLEKKGDSTWQPVTTGFNATIPRNAEYETFCADTFFNPLLQGNFILLRDQLYLTPIEPDLLRGIRTIRNGLHLGTCKKNRFEPSHALALSIEPNNVRRRYELSGREILRYLKGETLLVDSEAGWTLVTVSGYPIGWGKVSGGILKNHYPKGLRRMGNEE